MLFLQNALPLHKKQPNIRHLVLQFNIYFAKLVCATGKNEAFLRLVLVLWFSFTDSLPAKTRAHGFLKANPAKIV